MLLYELPEDVLLDILQHLHVCDIVALRQTCKRAESATRERVVWREALLRHSKQTRLPVPGYGERTDLPASELENLTIRALRLWFNWLSPNPTPASEIRIEPRRQSPHNRSARNLAVSFVPSLPDHILTLTLYDDVSRDRRYSFELWEVPGGDHAHYVQDLPMEALLSFAVNASPDETCTLTVTRRDASTQQCLTEVYCIDLSPAEGQSCFRLFNRFRGYRNTLGLYGPRLIVTDVDQHIRLIDVAAGKLETTLKVPELLNDPTLRPPERQCMDAVSWNGFVLSFCKQYIFLYRLAPASTTGAVFSDYGDEAHGDAKVDAIATYKWRWRIDSLVARPRLDPSPFTRKSAQRRPPLIDILIRFDTWFPWPINVLHHFALAPNPAYNPDFTSPADPADPTTVPYLLSATAGPFMVDTIPSPLRIFTPSDMVLGAHGTALWIDASTDAAMPSQAGDHGQRIAGKVLTHAPLPRERLLPGEDPQDDSVSPRFVESAPRGARESAGVRIAEDPVLGRSSVSVFQLQGGEERWNRVAVSEVEGRIAVGHIDGTVTVYTYMPN
ncbi:hypothetical protein BD413DRAFT_697426 [Trametes elegans]|nr:hypothetical protein BD413DRAFT_697426 [Trametes elegans]